MIKALSKSGNYINITGYYVTLFSYLITTLHRITPLSLQLTF